MPQSNESTTLTSARIWDIKCPPPANSTSSAIIQSTLGQFKTVSRRVSVEIYQVSPTLLLSSKDKIMHIIRNVKKARIGKRKAVDLSKEALRDDEICVVRFYDPVEYAANPVGVEKFTKYVGNVSKSITASLSTIQRTARKVGDRKQQQRSFSISKRSKLKRFVSRGRKARGEMDSSRNMDEDVNDDEDTSTVNNEDSFYNGAFVASEYGKNFEDIGDMRMGVMHDELWVERFALPLSGIVMHDVRDNLCVVTLCPGEDRWIYEFIFDTAIEAASFARLIRHQKELESNRIQIHLSHLSQKLQLSDHKPINLLVEISSAWDLYGSDSNALSIIGLGEAKSDPYVVVRLNHKEVHRTKVLNANLQPIWGLLTGSLFVITTTLHDFLVSNMSGVQFEIRDSDTVGYDDSLGAALVSPKELLEMNGKRKEFALSSLGCRQSYSEKWCKGFMAIRCRRIENWDVQYFHSLLLMHKKHETSPKIGLLTEGDNSIKGSGQNFVSGLVVKNKKVIVDDILSEKETVYRVRPRPIKSHAMFREWMTKEQIEAVAYEKSSHWIEGGAGNLGEIYLEIIGCDNLPNKDIGFNNKTDTIVSCIYSDVVVQTDVIFDCLSPRFMPWTQRAFMFHISHPSDLIHIGIFDYDDTANVDILNLNNRDRIGQLTIGISDFKPSTEYILNYDITKDESFADKHTYNGSITLRLRIEWADERHALLSSLLLPNIQRINLNKKSTFKMCRWAIDKECDNGAYSIRTITSYIDELYQYQYIVLDIQDAFETVILWRGTHKVNWPIDTELPLNSMAALALLSYLIETPEFLPSFLLLCVAWLLIAVNDKRRRHPSPLLRPFSFFEFLMIFIGIHRRSAPLPISSNYNKEEWKKLDEARLARNKKELKTMEQRLFEYKKEERANEVLVGENIDISTKLSSRPNVLGNVDPLKYVLYPWQILLGRICRTLRIIRNIILWENAFLSFWIAMSSILLAFVSFFIPWGKLCRLGARIIVYTLFGPWMKLVDRYYLAKRRNMSLTEKQQMELENESRTNIWKRLYASKTRIENEKLIRLRDFRVVQFGIYLVQVPRFNVSRFISRPTYKSSAAPKIEHQLTLAEKALEESGKNKTVVRGQSLASSLKRGDLLLRPEPVRMTLARTGEAFRDANGLSGAIPFKTDSRLKATLKISLLLCASLISSWYAVPILIDFVQKIRHLTVMGLHIIMHYRFSESILSLSDFFKVEMDFLKSDFDHLLYKLVR